MSGKFFKNWGLSFILEFVLTYVWHGIVFVSFYSGQLQKIGHFTADGKLAPLIAFLALGDILLGLGYSYFLPAISAVNGKYVVNGLVFGLVATGSLTILNHGIIAEWGFGILFADLCFGIIAGLLQGVLQKRLNRVSAPAMA